MARCILDKEKDPLGTMLSDFYCGDSRAFLNVWSSTLEMSPMQGTTMFRGVEIMNDVEKCALAACRGRILDVGAGAGCHSLALQSRGLGVDAIDISPGCVEVMRRRGIEKSYHRNILDLRNSRYDNVLMLMNGDRNIWLTGWPESLYPASGHLACADRTAACRFNRSDRKISKKG